jgi:hypothetical protein
MPGERVPPKRSSFGHPRVVSAGVALPVTSGLSRSRGLHILVAVGGAYMAVSPTVYRDGSVKLFPPDWHMINGATLDDAGAPSVCGSARRSPAW